MGTLLILLRTELFDSETISNPFPTTSSTILRNRGLFHVSTIVRCFLLYYLQCYDIRSFSNLLFCVFLNVPVENSFIFLRAFIWSSKTFCHYPYVEDEHSLMLLQLSWFHRIIWQSFTTNNTLRTFFSIDHDGCESIFNIWIIVPCFFLRPWWLPNAVNKKQEKV